MSQLLRGMTWDHPRGLDCLVASNPLLSATAHATVEWQARSLLAFGDQHIREFYKDVDLMIIDHPHVPDAVAAGSVVELDGIVPETDMALLKSTSVGGSHGSYQYHGKQWALAIDTAAQVSAYRPDRVDGAPIFWSDVMKLAKSGRLLWPYKPVDAFSTFATVMAQKGAPLAQSDSFLNREVALETLTLLVELAAAVPALCSTANPIQIAELLSETEDYDFGICMYGYSNYSRVGFRQYLLTYDDLPSFDGFATGSQLGGAGIAISSASTNIAKSVEIAVLLSLPQVQSSTYVAGGGQPGNLAAWKSEYANSITNNFFRNTLRTLERSWVRPRILGWTDLQFHSSQVIHEALVSRKVTDQTVEKIFGMYEKYIQE